MSKFYHRVKVMHLVNGMGVEYPAVLGYDTQKPFEVVCEFYVPQQDPVTWVFSRDLLTRACYHVVPYGDGDVQMYSCKPGEIVHVHLSVPVGPSAGFKADVHFPYEGVAAFLKRVDAAVPTGTEALHPDEIDELILAIMDWEDPRRG